MVVDASSRHPSMVLDPRNCQPHVEQAYHRRVERLGLHLEQQRIGALYCASIPNRAAGLSVQRSQIRNACGVRRARWGPLPSTGGRAYTTPVAPTYANSQQHGPTTQHPNRACPVSYSTMGPDIVGPTIGTGIARCIGQFWFRVVPNLRRQISAFQLRETLQAFHPPATKAERRFTVRPVLQAVHPRRFSRAFSRPPSKMDKPYQNLFM